MTNQITVSRVLNSEYIENSDGHLVTLLLSDGSVVEGWGLSSSMSIEEINWHPYSVERYSSYVNYLLRDLFIN